MCNRSAQEEPSQDGKVPEANASGCAPSALHCAGCQRDVRRIFSMYRPPRPPHEHRVCDGCTGILVAEGGKIAWTFIPLPSPPPFSINCDRCFGKFGKFTIVSSTGEPLILERCDDCAVSMKKDGWRAATVRGS